MLSAFGWSMAYDTLLVDTRDGVTTITLNRPQVLNAFNAQMIAELGEALRAAERDGETRAVVLTGSGRAFCAGADLSTRLEIFASGATPRLGEGLQKNYHPIIRRMRAMPKPILGAINGVAAGAGAGIALACDLRILADTASLLQAFVRIGLVPDAGNFYSLPRMVGLGRAVELAWLAEPLPAAETVQLGLAVRAVPTAELAAAAQELAARLARGPATAYGLIKRGLYRSQETDLYAMLEREALLQEVASRSLDFQEGLTAFREKRPPRFST
jgi:2-(1,2-epoxy-1,2-dihydrophenyl)acetyl-CoA isomerase